MKKFCLILGLLLLSVALGGPGYHGLETCPALGQYYYPPPPPYLSCNPSDPYCYYDYYSAPYTDPSSQFFYYVVPKIGEELEERHEFRERGRGHERREHREWERR